MTIELRYGNSLEWGEYMRKVLSVVVVCLVPWLGLAQPLGTVGEKNKVVNDSDLTAEEREILQKGEITKGRYITSGIVGTAAGFGIGHGIQGRYGELGWVFTVAETASVILLLRGLSKCVDDGIYDSNTDDDIWYARNGNEGCDSGLMSLGLVGFLGFHIWEIIDVWTHPPAHNRRYRSIKNRSSSPAEKTNFFILPTDKGATAGLAFTF